MNIWTEATDEVAAAMEEHFDEPNPVFMMANSVPGFLSRSASSPACAA